MTDVIYSTTATAWGGRQGKVVSSDNRLDLQLSSPKAMGGDDGPGTNPEQMFAAGYAACFHSALRSIAAAKKLDVSDSAVSVTISLVGSLAARELALAARIEAEIPHLDPVAAQALLEATHQLCPYSVATRGNIDSQVILVES
jgi:osmotically inducible protein OsmC